MNVNELLELAKAATPGPWMCDWNVNDVEDENEPADVSVWQRELFSGKLVNNICSDNAIIDGNYIAAANPSAILELIAAYREAVDALVFANKELKEWNSCSSGEDFNSIQINKALETAKRLGVE